MPIDGGDPVEVARFGDPPRPVLRDDFATDGDQVFFTVGLFEASVRVMDLVQDS